MKLLETEEMPHIQCTSSCILPAKDNPMENQRNPAVAGKLLSVKRTFVAFLANKFILGELKELDQLLKRLVTSAGMKRQREL